MTAGLLAFLTVLVIMGKFLDFLFGEKGEDTARPTLACIPPGKLVCDAGDPLDGSD